MILLRARYKYNHRLGKFSSGASDTLLLVTSGDKTAEQWHDDDDDDYSRNPKCSEGKLTRVQNCPLQNPQEMCCNSPRMSAVRTWKLRVIYGVLPNSMEKPGSW